MYRSLVTYGGAQAGVCIWKRADLPCTHIKLVYVFVYLSVFFSKISILRGHTRSLNMQNLSVCLFVGMSFLYLFLDLLFWKKIRTCGVLENLKILSREDIKKNEFIIFMLNTSMQGFPRRG